MALDLLGISNENEFYASHYLASVLERDLRGHLRRWRALEHPPWDRLRGLRQLFFQACHAYEGTRDCGERLSVQRLFTVQLFSVLGYGVRPRLQEMEGVQVPLLSAVGGSSRSSARLLIVEVLGEEGRGLLELPVDAVQNGGSVGRWTLGKLINDVLFLVGGGVLRCGGLSCPRCVVACCWIVPSGRSVVRCTSIGGRY